MAWIVLRYRVLSEFICRLFGDTDCVSCPAPIKVIVCEEMFKVGFLLLLHPFIKRLLARYRLVPAQLHSNTWRGIINFLVKCIEVILESKMRALRSVLYLKVDLVRNLVVYTNYKSIALALLVSKSLHMWGNSLCFIRTSFRPWAIEYIWRFRLRLDSFYRPPHLSATDRKLI